MAKREIKQVANHLLQQVFLTVEDHIAVMTLHNPPVNAVSGIMQEEILLLCDYIDHDDLRREALYLAGSYRDKALMDNDYAADGYARDMELEHVYAEAEKRLK